METFYWSLFLFVVIVPPVYCARQEPTQPFLKGYLWGGALGVVPGILVVVALGGGGPEAVGGMLVALVGGGIWGAYMGVALTGLFVGPIPRQVGTQWGAAAGLGVALPLWAVATWMGTDTPSFGSHNAGDVVLTLLIWASFVMALGGMIGAQVGLYLGTDHLTRRRMRRRWGADLLVVVGVMGGYAVLPLGFGYLGKLGREREKERVAREVKAHAVEQRFPGNSQAFRQLQSGNPTERANAARNLGNSPMAGGDERVIPALLKAARDDAAGVRAAVAQSLGNLRAAQIQRQQGGPDDPRVMDALEKLLRDPDPAVRLQAVWALGQVGSRRVTGLLREAANDPDPKVRAAAAAMAGQFQGRPGVPAH